MNLDEYRSTHIGIVFQSYNLLPYLTALENVTLAMDISKEKITNKKDKALQLMQKVGLDESYANRKILKKCIIIVTHSENVCKQVDTVYELKKQK